MLDALYDAGQVSGRDGDKWARFGFVRLPASHVAAPLVDGCIGWLECRVVDTSLATKMDLFVCETIAAWADDTVYRNGELRFNDRERRSVHHLAGGRFFVTGDARTARGAKKKG